MSNPLIIGMGITGRSIQNWYRKQNIEPYIFDDKTPCSIEWKHVHVVHPSPGISLNHPVYQEALKRSIPIESDAHIAQRLFPQHRYMGITGSNGKSTTSALLSHILDGPVLFGGNIGTPILDCLPQTDDIHTFVWELSSFQLDIGASLHFDAAALLNLSPNHLDRHGTMTAYRAAKMRIFDKTSWGVTGIDVPEAQCPVEHMGREFGLEQNGIRVGNKTFEFPKHLLGRHNAENAAFAIAMALHMGTDSDLIQERLHTFYSLPHRLELVWAGSWQGKHLRIINDSKSTTAEATRSALMALPSENIWWIGGGVPKEGGISSIASLLGNLAGRYLIGEASHAFATDLAASKNGKTLVSDVLFQAVNQALHDIRMTDAKSAVLLLSPACASYDQFQNFEHRGDVFKEYIRSIADFQEKEPTCAA